MRILRFCGYMRKFSLQNLGRGILWHGKSEQSAKVFSVKIVFFTDLRKFSPSKVSHYVVTCPLQHTQHTHTHSARRCVLPLCGQNGLHAARHVDKAVATGRPSMTLFVRPLTSVLLIASRRASVTSLASLTQTNMEDQVWFREHGRSFLQFV